MKKKLLKFICIITVALLTLSACSSKPNYYYSGGGGGNRNNVPAMAGTQTTANTVKGDKTVAITFDDGPHNIRTKAIVDELAKYGYHATFFVVGNRIDGTEYNGSAAMKYAAEKGNEIGIHGYTHGVYYDTCSASVFSNELSKTDDAIKALLPKQTVKLMRPVGGRITDERVKNCKYSVIMWSVDSEDWKYKYSDSDSHTEEEKKQLANKIVDNIMSEVHDGSIILMHDIYQSTCDAVVLLLQRLNSEGYNVVTVSDLLGKNMSVGKMYSSK